MLWTSYLEYKDGIPINQVCNVPNGSMRYDEYINSNNNEINEDGHDWLTYFG